ncbi:PAS domain-containing protein [Hwanghaeella grinnelliae]|uniref:PAS domain-containing protein n=1 Tax=Hwanghaeella grinnelliae TaxID=2500179 RepID=A0A437QJU8_9PROT|nr:PAS domain-containing protein [Hwanghaeella grinnelliae]RVU34768.1 PAS domain-containing protein [Hwanghaeella grinnelliae]
MPTDGTERFEAYFGSEILRIVFRHWNEARGDRVMPSRNDIDPYRLGRALSNVWLYERGPDDEFSCRLSGELINRAHSQSIMKRPAREILGPDYDYPIRQRMNFVLDTPAVLFASTAAPADDRTVTRISLPLSDPAGRPTFTFGASEYLDPDRYIDRDAVLVGRADTVVVFSLPDFQRIASDKAP